MNSGYQYKENLEVDSKEIKRDYSTKRKKQCYHLYIMCD